MRASKRPSSSLAFPCVLALALACRAEGAVSRDPALVSAEARVFAPTSSAVDEPVLHEADLAAAAQRLLADVAWLADDARQGRRAGLAGERAAAEWLAARLTELGLEPAGEGGWTQPFEVPLPPRLGGGSEIVWRHVAGEDVETGRAAAVPLFCSSAGSAKGRLVFAEHGIVFDEREWNDYEGLDVEGAVVAVVRGAPEVEALEAETEEAPAAESPHGAPSKGEWGSSASIFHKVMEAKRRGAVAVILLPRTPGEPLLEFDVGRGGVAGIPAVTMGREAFEFLRGAHEVEVSADVIRADGTARNVLGRLPGRREGSRTIVVGAHFDHLGFGGLGSLAKDATGEIHNGADDNASGTAVVLEVARALAEGEPLESDVLFALWSGEELGLLGSEHWMRNPTVPLDSVAANVNLDMVGRAGDGVLTVLGAGTAEGLTPLLETEGPRAGLELQINASGRGMGGSDHQSFLKREVPALHLFSGVHPDYHRPSDDVEGFEERGAARVAALTAALVRRLDAAGRLAWVAPPEDEERRAQGGFRTRLGTIPEYAYDGEGVLLAGTSPGLPAERGGLLAGDVLIGVGDVEIETVHDLVFALNAHKPGDVVLVRYLRDGEEQEVRVTLDSPDLE